MIGPLLALARRIGFPESMLLFAVGVGSTFVPGLPPPTIDPELVFSLFLPPLLYASTVRVTWHLFRFTFWPGLVLGALLVAVAIGVVALVTRTFFLPGLSWSAAILLGMIAAFFDTRLFHEAKGRLRVPRPIGDTLKSREIVGRILILATLGLVEDRLTSTGSVGNHLLQNFALAIPGGILAGLAVGALTVLLRKRIDPAPVEIAVSIATPYAAALIAKAADVSAAAAIITSALVVSAVRVDRRSGATMSSNEARINATAFWEEASLMISSGLFLLAGRAVPGALAGLQNWPFWQLAGAAAGILAVALAVQFFFSLAATRMPPIKGALEERERRTSPAAAAAVMTWSSTRSVLALLVALSIPATLPGGTVYGERDLILALASLIVIGSLLVQGLTLRRVVKRSGLADASDDEEEEAEARAAMRDAAAAPSPQHASGSDAARQELLRLREQDEIGDEVMTRMMREADLTARAAEKDALPGAGPPQP